MAARISHLFDGACACCMLITSEVLISIALTYAKFVIPAGFVKASASVELMLIIAIGLHSNKLTRRWISTSYSYTHTHTSQP